MAESFPEQIDLPLPLKGVYQTSAYHRVPEGFSVYANNVIAYDSGGRARVGVRPGTARYFPTSGTNSLNFGNGTNGAFIQYMGQVNVQDTSTNAATLNKLLIVSGGRAYLQLPGDTSLTRIDGGGAATFSAGRRVSCVTFQNVSYFSDGLVVKQYDHAAATFADWTASAGTFPASNSQYARYLCVWRGRIGHLHFDRGTPGIVFFSAMNGPRDYDYGSTNGATIAFATNTNFKAGQMGDQGAAFIPASEDRLYIGLDHSLYVFEGDPGAGGSFVPVSETIGVLNDDAWCMVGSTIYFMSNVGFCRLVPGGEIEPVSDITYKQAWKDLPQIGYYIELEYDAKRSLIWIFVTKELSPFSTLHACYDLRAEKLYGVGAGFWPISFPSTTGGDDLASGTTAPRFGPTKACVFDGGSGTTSARLVLLGGRDGYIRYFDETLLNDNGVADTAISSEVWLGPARPAGALREFLINGHALILAATGTNTSAAWSLLGGTDPYAASNSASITLTGTTTTAGRNSLGDRGAANTFWGKLANSTIDKTLALEEWTLRVAMGGEVR